jgi:ERCC4-related helicase
MKNWYFVVPIDERPVVFGMTASPGGDETVETTYIALQKLMDALDSIIIIPREHTEELKQYVHPV